MKKMLRFLCIFIGIMFSVRAVANNLMLLDKVVAIVDGPERRYTICQSELNKIGIDGIKPTLQDLITEELIYQDALKHKIPLDDYADRYIRSIKQAHNIDDKEVHRIFESAGLTPEEGRLKLEKMGANKTMVDIKATSRITIALSDVEEVYAKNPRYEESRYFIEVAFVPFFSRDPVKQEEQYSFLMHQCNIGELDVVWGSPFWINESELAGDKKFITTMNSGEISKPQRVANGYELYRLRDKKNRRLLTLDERYREIVDQLRAPKFKEVFDAYIDELYKTASIIYVD